MTGYPMVCPAVEWLEIDGQVLAFDGALLHLLPGSAAQIWLSLDGAASTAQIAAALAARHDGTEVERDVRAFVADLVERGLVVTADEPVGNDLRVPSYVAWTVDEDQVVLADVRTGARQALSLTGSRVWLLIVQRLSRQEMFVRLAADFPDVPAGFAAEVEALLGTLVDQGLLAPTGTATA